jgi:hypothetical protein
MAGQQWPAAEGIEGIEGIRGEMSMAGSDEAAS